MFERVLNTPLPTISKLREISNLQKPEVTVQKCSENIQQITLRHECSPVNLRLIFRAPFPKNTSGRLLKKQSHRDTNILKIKLMRVKGDKTPTFT